MANALYNSGRNGLLNGGIDLDTNTIKAALVSNAYTPNLATHANWSDVSANVIGTPTTLATPTVGTVGPGVFDAAVVSFTAVASGAVTYVAIYKDTGTANTSTLIALIDTATGLPVTANGGDITITWNASGIITLS